jgi:chemotaxis protein MotB
MGMEDQIQIKYTSSGLLIRMGDKVMFDVGKAELKPSAYPLLDIIGEMVRDKAKEVLVSGHTDNVPINTPLYPSNWELSLARAMVVVRYMMNNANVAPEKLVPTGYAEYRPVAPNTTDESRQFYRRVEFLVTWKKTEFLK